jgi:hypothetical protein
LQIASFLITSCHWTLSYFSATRVSYWYLLNVIFGSILVMTVADDKKIICYSGVKLMAVLWSFIFSLAFTNTPSPIYKLILD